MTLYAKWTKHYTITYDANGGQCAPPVSSKVPEHSTYLTSWTPVRNGYVFLGWSENKDSEKGDYAAGGEFTEDKDVTLYAIWKEWKRPKLNVKNELLLSEENYEVVYIKVKDDNTLLNDIYYKS
jgi:uncharacterized repeat protein (TIGR02543 family)